MPSILHKRSSTTGSIPTTSSLSVGEIAINVADGKMFIHKSSSAGESIESPIVSNSTTSIGTTVLSGSLVISGSLTSINSGTIFDISAQNILFDFENLEFTGSASVTGSLKVNSLTATGSLLGTASYATQALSASYAPGGGSGTVNSGAAGKVAYYPTTNTTVDDAGTLNWDNSNNSLGVGTTAPSSTNFKLAVNGGIDIADNTQAIFRIGSHLASSGYPQAVIQMGSTATRFDFEKYGGGVQFTVNDAGNAKITTSLGVGVNANGTSGRIDAANDIVAYSSSDKNWKKNIKPIENAVEKVKQISGNTFEWIEDTNPVSRVHGNKGKDVGVIAQEIEAVLPEIVTTRESGMKAVKYDKLVALLIEAIKEQQKQIDELKAKL